MQLAANEADELNCRDAQITRAFHDKVTIYGLDEICSTVGRGEIRKARAYDVAQLSTERVALAEYP
jgi:hypothetical protein